MGPLMYTVLILEDDPVASEAATRLVELSPRLSLAGVSARLDEARNLLALKPDFILADLVLEDGQAFDFISTAKAQTAAKILVFSVLGDEESVLGAIRSGADGYIKKEADLDELESAMDAVLRGEAPMSPKIARHLLRSVKAQRGEMTSNGPDTPRLTPRECQVLEGLAHGLNYKEVARRHDLSHHTVAKYIKTIYRKLAVSSRAEAVLEGVRKGIIDI